MSKKIHKHIGALTFNLKNGKTCSGSGVLLSPNLVLTVAHNIYCKTTRQIFSNFKFYPAQCGIMNKYYEIEDISIPGAYFLNPLAMHDYALLKLK